MSETLVVNDGTIWLVLGWYGVIVVSVLLAKLLDIIDQIVRDV